MRSKKYIIIVITFLFLILVGLYLIYNTNVIYNSLIFYQLTGSDYEKLRLIIPKKDDYKLLKKYKTLYLEMRPNMPEISRYYGNRQFYLCHNELDDKYTVCFNKYKFAMIVSDHKNIDEYCKKVNSIKTKIKTDDFDQCDAWNFIRFHLENHYDEYYILMPQDKGNKGFECLKMEPDKRKALIIGEYGPIFSIKNLKSKDIEEITRELKKSSYTSKEGELHYRFIIGKEMFKYTGKLRRAFICFIAIQFHIDKNGNIKIEEKKISNHYPLKFI